MQTQRILIIGGPSTGKSSVISALKESGFFCFEEISREVTLAAQKEGIEQLFLDEPLLFSEKLLEGRISQFNNADSSSEDFVFYDRGIPDIVAYLDYVNSTYPNKFIDACENYKYDRVFLFELWEQIYQQDNERYESFEEAKLIQNYLKKTYKKYGYELEIIPFGTIEERTQYILNKISKS